MYHRLGRDPSPSATAASGGPIVSSRARFAASSSPFPIEMFRACSQYFHLSR